MEPHTALARFEGEKLTVWASTQSPFGLQDGIVRELGLTRENVQGDNTVRRRRLRREELHTSRGSRQPGLHG